MGFLAEVLVFFTTADNYSGRDGIVQRVVDHLGLSALSMLAALAVALPLGLALGHTGRGAVLAINVSNLGRAVPSFAILVLSASVLGIGAEPAFVALVALGIPPVVTNTYTAIRQVDADVREAAEGMGFTGWQLLSRVEIPLAVPLIMAGVRTATVQVVATASLAAIVGWRGLGRYVIDGLATRNFVLVFVGAVLVALVSLLAEGTLAALQRILTPKGSRPPRVPASSEFGLGT